jgi:hypothetical protein
MRVLNTLLLALSYHIISYHISFISIDPYRNKNPYGYGKLSHQDKMYKTITIFGALVSYRLFDILR